MATRRRRSPKRLIRFLFFLIILFLAAYFLSGGLAVFSSKTWQSAGAFLPRPTQSVPANEMTDEVHHPGFSDRLSRVIFLRRAVESRVNVHDPHYVKLQDTPESLQQAVIAVEDRRFYSHHGFDFEGIARATLVNLQSGTIEEGASTITQQLVKNLFLSHEQSFGRKAEEFLLALDMEWNYSKDARTTTASARPPRATSASGRASSPCPNPPCSRAYRTRPRSTPLTSTS